MYKLLRSAILAGICIAIGGTIFLKLGGIAGAVLFSFGLITVVSYKLKLYTGTAGFFEDKTKQGWKELGLILLGNIIGCFIVALLVSATCPDLIEDAQCIIEKRMNNGFVTDGIMAIFCGFIMTTAVNFARQDKFLPLLFGVPLFILAGFTHSIADAFYFLMDYKNTLVSGEMLLIYVFEVIGNFIGCNLYRKLNID